MKKVYMPNDKVLFDIQELAGANMLYNYLLVKAAETLIVDGINLSAKGILNPNCVYKVTMENEALMHAIGYVYPEVIERVPILEYDAKLCQKLLAKETNEEVKKLDNLRYFKSSVLSNPEIVRMTIGILARGLMNNPEYRFEYEESSLLEDIFSTRLTTYPGMLSSIETEDLCSIEPAYAFILDNVDTANNLRDGLKRYLTRYDMDSAWGREYSGKDILHKPDINVRRLTRIIKKDKFNLY